LRAVPCSGDDDSGPAAGSAPGHARPSAKAGNSGRATQTGGGGSGGSDVAGVGGDGRPAGRARQEVDDGWYANEGYAFGSLQPAMGEALVATHPARMISSYVTFLAQVEAWVPTAVERVYAVADNFNVHTAYDALLFSLAHPRGECVFQPRDAAYLNLIEPWWKTLKSMALKGRRFEMWAEVEAAVHTATAYGNAHRHPFVWGQRRRRRTPRTLGLASLPCIALL